MTVNNEQLSQENPSTVYGPVPSWRFGNSLGVDLLLVSSICSFNCIYCQLGNIQNVTTEQRVYVPTERVIEDFQNVNWDKVDIVAISGNGEPTLALNLGEVIDHIKEAYDKPVLVLTNATTLEDKATRERLMRADILSCKLDAPDDETLRRVNRPAAGISVDRIVRGIKALKADGFPGTLAIQCMFLPLNIKEARRLAELIRDIGPDEIQLNTPKRPYPREWYLDARGNHSGVLPVEGVELKTISWEEAREIERLIREVNPDTRILSVYKEAPEE